MASQQNLVAGGASTQAGRSFMVQQAFAELGRPTASISELSFVSGLDSPTVSRVVQSGINLGFFCRVKRGLYSLASQIPGRGSEVAGPLLLGGSDELDDLRRTTNKGLVFLYARSPFGVADLQCIDMAIGTFDLTILGTTRQHLLCATYSLRVDAPGRAILAYLPEPTQEAVASSSMPPVTGPGALHDQDVFRSALADVRDTGYAVGLQESHHGWHSIAAPVFMSDAVMGSVLVLMPAEGLPEPSPDLVAATQLTAARLSRRAAIRL